VELSAIEKFFLGEGNHGKAIFLLHSKIFIFLY